MQVYRGLVNIVNCGGIPCSSKKEGSNGEIEHLWCLLFV